MASCVSLEGEGAGGAAASVKLKDGDYCFVMVSSSLRLFCQEKGQARGKGGQSLAISIDINLLVRAEELSNRL